MTFCASRITLANVCSSDSSTSRTLFSARRTFNANSYCSTAFLSTANESVIVT
jgi:hypothetical protein